MKKNKLFLLGLFVVFAAVLSLSLVSNTLAKYTTSDSASDKARVAKWGVTITAEAYADDQLEADLSTEEEHIVKLDAGLKTDLLAPGTGVNFASVDVTGTPEVAVKVTYVAELELGGWEVDGAEYMPLVFVINGADYSYAGVGAADIDAFEAKIEELIAAFSESYDAGTDLGTANAGILTVSCYWAFDGDDAKDTKLGDLATAPTVDLTITCTVTQVN